MTKKTRETELKLMLNEPGYQTLLAEWPHKGPMRLQENYFLDTSSLLMRNRGWALRVRRDNEDFFLTAKGPSNRGGGITDRIEIEAPIHSHKASSLLEGAHLLSAIAEEPSMYLLESFGDLEVSKWMGFTNRRQVLDFEGIDLELDHSVIGEANRYELEVELDLDKIQNIRPHLEEALKGNGIAFWEAEDSKLAWACSQA